MKRIDAKLDEILMAAAAMNRSHSTLLAAVQDAADTCDFYGAGIPFAKKLGRRMRAALKAARR